MKFYLMDFDAVNSNYSILKYNNETIIMKIKNVLKLNLFLFGPFLNIN